jgi:hypothetical protein
LSFFDFFSSLELELELELELVELEEIEKGQR